MSKMTEKIKAVLEGKMAEAKPPVEVEIDPNGMVTFPDGATFDEALAALTRIKQLNEEGENVYNITYEFEAFVWDGALAIDRAIKEVFGFGVGEITRSFWGDRPPQLIQVSTGPNLEDKVMVPWGKIVLPGVDGELHLAAQVANGKFIVKVIAVVKRKHQKQMEEMARAVRRHLASSSIYRGKAIEVDFDSDLEDPWTGETIPNPPKFLTLDTSLTEDNLILNRDVKASVKLNLFTIIDHIAELRALGLSGKRGVLLTGTYGTGKTLTSNITANKAVAQGVTYLLCKNAHQLPKAIEFAQMYAPCVVFCEDADRSLSGGRSVEMDEALNTLDGIESKGTEVIVVLTTNNIDSIHPAALRPGRIDSVINFELPDEETTEQLIRLYAGEALPERVDVSLAAKQLTGNVPAVIAEAVHRAKLVCVSSGGLVKITPEAMLVAAESMHQQRELLTRPRPLQPTDLEKAALALGTLLCRGLTQAAQFQPVQRVAENALPNN